MAASPSRVFLHSTLIVNKTTGNRYRIFYKSVFTETLRSGHQDERKSDSYSTQLFCALRNTNRCSSVQTIKYVLEDRIIRVPFPAEAWIFLHTIYTASEVHLVETKSLSRGSKA